MLWWLTPGEGGLQLHDAVGINRINGTTTDIKAQVSSMWAKGCMFDDCVFVI